MPIPDPQAIPETADACAEYLTEADAAWAAGDVTTAEHLYHSLQQSALSTRDQAGHATYRLALIALNNGDHDAARTWAASSSDPAAADLMHSIDNAAGPAQADITRPPANDHETELYWAEGTKARSANDLPTAAAWFDQIIKSSAIPPETRARAEVVMALILHGQGDDKNARAWMEHAWPNLVDEELIKAARDLYDQIGVHVQDDTSSPAAHQLAAGIEAFELGDAAAARPALEAAMHLDGATDEIKGRAGYYIGAMDYQEHKYADARDHLERAAAIAPDPEKTWAHEMLHSRWEES